MRVVAVVLCAAFKNRLSIQQLYTLTDDNKNFVQTSTKILKDLEINK